ncbi:MAG: hypothetical protein AB1758_30440 [Candidatus Eremiobacterota bacterium]
MDLNEARYAKLVASSWMDPAVRQRLLDNPAEALKEARLPIQDGVEVRFTEGEVDPGQSREELQRLLRARAGQQVEMTLPPIPPEFVAMLTTSPASAFPSSGLGSITQLAMIARDINVSTSVSVSVVTVAVVVTTVTLS